MAFPSRAPAPTATTPPQQAAPAPGAGLAPPGQMMPPSAVQPPAAAELKVHVSQNGQPAVLMTVSQARALPGNSMAISEDQSSGWMALSDFLARVAPTPAAPTPGFAPPQIPGGRAAFGAPAPQHPAQSQPMQQSVVPRGMFAAVGNASISRSGNYIMSGDYICKVVEAQFKSPQQGGSFQGVIVELEVIVSSFDANDPSKQNCNREGSRMSAFIKQNLSFAGNMKEVMLAVSGFDAAGKARPEEDFVSEDECLALVSPAQPYKDVLVYLEARDKPLQNNPNQLFTKVSWWPCPRLPDGSPDTEKLFREVR